MKRVSIIYVSMLFIGMLSFAGCNDRFEELQVNPNKPTQAAPINVLQGLIRKSWISPWNDASKYAQYWVDCYQLYGHQDYQFGRYDMNYNELLNIEQMEKEVERIGSAELKPFLAIGKFFKAFYYIRMSEYLGDIPMSEAMQGAIEGNFTPKYDTQKEVYLNCLKLLEEANNDIKPHVASVNIGADLFYNGDLHKWQKAINTFHIRVLMSLSKRLDDSQINPAQRLKAIVDNPNEYPIMTSNEDNMQIRYQGNTNDRYPLYPDDQKQLKQRRAIGETYLKISRKTEDPRIFKQADPAANNQTTDSPAPFNAYVGAETGEEMSKLNINLGQGKYATLRYELYVTPKGIPCIQLGYPELQFTLAEAANRGWIPGNATTYYTNGIKADMEAYGIEKSDVDTFLTKNAYKGNNTQGLTQILEQKYVAMFQNSGWQPFMEQRRTGIPAYHVGPGNVNGKIPVRWMYPESELLYNEKNLLESLQRQFGGTDDINNLMWLIK